MDIIKTKIVKFHKRHDVFVPVPAQVTQSHRIKFKATSWSPNMASESA